jgi:WD40 repeat protein
MQLSMPNLAESISTHIRNFSGHPYHIHRVLFLDKDSIFVSGCNDGLLLLWSRIVEEPTHILRGHTKSIHRMISHDNLLVSGAFDNTVRIWDLATGECIRVLEGHSSYISVLMFSPNYSLLRTGCANGEVRIWNWRDGYAKTTCIKDPGLLTYLSIENL